MNLESLLVYGLAAAGGWLLRHLGVGAAVKVPGVSTDAPTPSAGGVPVLATLKADIDQIVKAAIKQAIDDIKGAAAAQPPQKS